MEHKKIEALAEKFVKGKIDFPEQVNPHVQKITLRLVGDLMKAINDLHITADEYWSGVAYIGDLGKDVGLVGYNTFETGAGNEKRNAVGLSTAYFSPDLLLGGDIGVYKEYSNENTFEGNLIRGSLTKAF